MTAVPETHRDLLDAEVASLSTIGADGFPQVTLVWFLHDTDGTLGISLNTARRKTRNLRARPECTLLIADAGNPYRYIEIRARARLEPDDDYVFAGEVGKKYSTDLRTRDRPGETRVKVTLDIVKVISVAIR